MPFPPSLCLAKRSLGTKPPQCKGCQRLPGTCCPPKWEGGLTPGPS